MPNDGGRGKKGFHAMLPEALRQIVEKSKEPPVKKKEDKGSPSNLHVSAQGKEVVIQFERQVTRVALNPEQAQGLAQALMHCAMLAVKKKLIVVPGKD